MSISRSVTANFSAISLQVHAANGGTISIAAFGCNCANDCSYQQGYGQNVTLYPQPATGYLFAGWSGDCSGIDTCQITMDAVHEVTARFKTLQFSTYMPLVFGNSWSYSSLGGVANSSTVTVGAPFTINSRLAYPLTHGDGNIVYYTNDTSGLRIHGQYAPKGLYTATTGWVSTTVYFDPPINLVPAGATPGRFFSFT